MECSGTPGEYPVLGVNPMSEILDSARPMECLPPPCFPQTFLVVARASRSGYPPEVEPPRRQNRDGRRDSLVRKHSSTPSHSDRLTDLGTGLTGLHVNGVFSPVSTPSDRGTSRPKRPRRVPTEGERTARKTSRPAAPRPGLAVALEGVAADGR